MPKLPDDKILANDIVSDTLSSAMIISVSILNEERSKEQPNQAVIDKFKSAINEIEDIQDQLNLENMEEMQAIDDKYVQFIKENKR